MADPTTLAPGTTAAGSTITKGLSAAGARGSRASRAGVVRARRADRPPAAQAHADYQPGDDAAHGPQVGGQLDVPPAPPGALDLLACEHRADGAHARAARQAHVHGEAAAAGAHELRLRRRLALRPHVLVDPQRVEAARAVGEPDLAAVRGERGHRHREVARLPLVLGPRLR